MIVSKSDCERYADILLHLVAVDKGDLVLINTMFGQEDIVFPLVEKAYARGAKHVGLQLRDQKLVTLRAMHSNPDYLQYLPRSGTEMLREYSDAQACVISIRSPLDVEFGTNASAEALSKISKAYMQANSFFHEAVVSDQFSWIVAGYPSKEWGQNVFPQLEGEEAAQKLWQAMRKILLLDTEDPISAWEQRIRSLQKRQTVLNSKKYHALHLVSDNTDFYVSLNQRSEWSAATHTSRNKKRFQANVPTEESYATPDCRYSYGTVCVSRPIIILGKIVDDIRMTFRQGKVVEAHAGTGNDVLQSFLELDERNRYLGEIALVDTKSLVWKSGLVFKDILYDENAGTHFALGTGYTSGFGFGPEEKETEETLIGMGCNVSKHHLDFTVGHEKLQVFGLYYSDGDGSGGGGGDIASKKAIREEPIIKDGLFVID